MAAPSRSAPLDRSIAKAAHSRPAERRKRRYALAIVTAVCVAITVLGLGAHLGAFQPQRTTNPSQRLGEQSAPTTDADENRTGKIVLQTQPEQCVQMKFDNSNGRFTDRLKPCEDQIRFDEHGRPIPMGTIHRLDAISRSFFGH